MPAQGLCGERLELDGDVRLVLTGGFVDLGHAFEDDVGQAEDVLDGFDGFIGRKVGL